jgi:hypothetical protein
MSDYLTSLAGRSIGMHKSIIPRPISLFEPQHFAWNNSFKGFDANGPSNMARLEDLQQVEKTYFPTSQNSRQTAQPAPINQSTSDGTNAEPKFSQISFLKTHRDSSNKHLENTLEQHGTECMPPREEVQRANAFVKRSVEESNRMVSVGLKGWKNDTPMSAGHRIISSQTKPDDNDSLNAEESLPDISPQKESKNQLRSNSDRRVREYEIIQSHDPNPKFPLNSRSKITSKEAAAVSKPKTILVQPRIEPHSLPKKDNIFIPRSEEKPEPIIRVTIGRIEVRAMNSPPKPKKDPVAPAVMGLEEYLRGQNMGGQG